MNLFPMIKNAAFVLLSAVFLYGCNPKETSTDTDGSEETSSHHEGDEHMHNYACPMHPEVNGHEGEKCSKCGMALEHMDHAPVVGNYKMEFKSAADGISAGKPASLIFIPKNASNPSAAVPLDVEHEKKIHLIAVSEDLSWFDHIHPEYQADGSYVVTETFPAGGAYRLYADYKPTGSTHQLENIPLQVAGKSKSPVTYSSVKTTANSDDFAVMLKPDNGKFFSNQEIHFDGQFTRKGKRFDVNELQSYLGAKGHMVAIHLQSKTYVHLHPEVENDILHFHATFPEPGMYRAWLQFSADDKIHTTDFAIMVDKGEARASEDAHGNEQQSDHQH